MPAQGRWYSSILFVFCSIAHLLSHSDGQLKFPFLWTWKPEYLKINTMNKLLWVLFLLLWVLCAEAQVLPKGRVLDSKTKAPISGLTVEMVPLGLTLTNDQGIFEFRKSKMGNYKLRISGIGYRSYEAMVAVDGREMIQVSLEQIPLFLEPIEVKALRVDSQAPFSVSNLGRSDIEKTNFGQDLPYMLDQTPSALINSDAGNGIGYTGIRIRGTDETRINVTLNGIPVNDAEDQGVYFVDIPDLASSINSIQVQRGVGTSTNGAGAFGASINISTNEFNDKPYAELNNSLGSFDSWKNTVKAGSGMIDNHFTIDTRLSRISSEGYIDRGSSDLKSLYLSGAYLSTNSSIRFNLITGTEKTYQAWDGIPEAKLFGSPSDLHQYYQANIGSSFFTPGDSINLFNSRPRRYNYFTYPDQTDNYEQDYYQLLFNHSFNKYWDLNTALFLTRGKGYYIEYQPQQNFADYGLEDPVYNGDTLYTTDLIRQLWLNNYFYGGIFSVQYHHSKDQLNIGGGWDRYDGKHYGIVTWAQVGFPNDFQYYYNLAHKTDWNVYAKWQRRLNEKWSSFLDLQLRNIIYHINGFDDNPNLIVNKDFYFFNPKAGLSFTDPSGWNGYLSAGIANHEPNRDDFEANEQQQPKPEHLLDLEANIGNKAKLIQWNTTVYYMYYRNQLVLTGKINYVGEYTRTNIPESYRAGIESELGIKPSKWFNLNLNLAMSQNKISNFSEYLYDGNGGEKINLYHSTNIALSPDMVGGATLDFIPFPSLTLSLMSKYVSRQYLDNTSKQSRSIDPYFNENARISWKIPQSLFKEMELMLMVYNVFNARYESTGYSYSYLNNQQTVSSNFYFPMAGTNGMLTLNIKF
jgi:iron complex outermembrane recepter protein